MGKDLRLCNTSLENDRNHFSCGGNFATIIYFGSRQTSTRFWSIVAIFLWVGRYYSSFLAHLSLDAKLDSRRVWSEEAGEAGGCGRVWWMSRDLCDYVAVPLDDHATWRLLPPAEWICKLSTVDSPDLRHLFDLLFRYSWYWEMCEWKVGPLNDFRNDYDTYNCWFSHILSYICEKSYLDDNASWCPLAVTE